MGAQDTESLDDKLARGERLIAVWKELSAANVVVPAPANSNHVSTVLNLGGAGLLLGALIGVLGVWAAIDARREARADARVMAAERKADLRELSALMSRVEGVESQVRADRILITKAEQRITQLEPKQ